MNIDFIQGIITYPTYNNQQDFLKYSGGYVSVDTTRGRIDVAFSHGTENYLFTESADVTNAWGPLSTGINYWLYWDIDKQTADRTFGYTTIQPIVSSSAPQSPVIDQHWFNLTDNKMYRFYANDWRECIRVFAAKINNNIFTPLGSSSSLPYAGTQVGVTSVGIVAGRIIVDDTGTPIRRANGQFFTSESDFFINGSPVNTIRLEANVFVGTALESIAKYQVVKFSEFGKINLALYDDEQTTAIAMSMQDINQEQVGTLCMQGYITNPEWNWTTVGAPLWVHGSIPGLLVDIDPHVSDVVNHPIGKSPVARVITPTSVFFDQGLGGKGDKGDQGSTTVPLATQSVYGISKLSVAASDPANPIVVGDNDPRNSNARVPLPHSQAASTIITTPYGILAGSDLQSNLQLINDNFVKKSGDVMTGYLTLNANPVNSLHAATKNYVDTRDLENLANVTITNPTVGQALIYTGVNNKWINGNVANSLATLTDVALDNPSNGNSLIYYNGKWTNAAGGDGLWEIVSGVNDSGVESVAASIYVIFMNCSTGQPFTSTAELASSTTNLSGAAGNGNVPATLLFTYTTRTNDQSTTKTCSFNTSEYSNFNTVQDIVNGINSKTQDVQLSIQLINNVATIVITATSLTVSQLTTVDPQSPNVSSELIGILPLTSQNICSQVQINNVNPNPLQDNVLRPKQQTPDLSEISIHNHTYINSDAYSNTQLGWFSITNGNNYNDGCRSSKVALGKLSDLVEYHTVVSPTDTTIYARAANGLQGGNLVSTDYAYDPANVNDSWNNSYSIETVPSDIINSIGCADVNYSSTSVTLALYPVYNTLLDINLLASTNITLVPLSHTLSYLSSTPKIISVTMFKDPELCRIASDTDGNAYAVIPAVFNNSGTLSQVVVFISPTVNKTYQISNNVTAEIDGTTTTNTVIIPADIAIIDSTTAIISSGDTIMCVNSQTGNINWSKSYSLNSYKHGTMYQITKVSYDSTHNVIYAVGCTPTSVFVISVSATSGSLNWCKTISTTNDTMNGYGNNGYSPIVTYNNNQLFVAYTQFVNNSTLNNRAIKLIALDTQGNFVWGDFIGHTSFNICTSIRSTIADSNSNKLESFEYVGSISSVDSMIGLTASITSGQY